MNTKQHSDEDKSQSRITCERWKLSGGHRPEMRQSQTITIPIDQTRLYKLPIRGNIVGRPPPISCTPDFKFLRIGSSIFAESESGNFEARPSLNDNDHYFEEMASRGPFLATATRRCLSEKDIDNTTGLDDFKLEDFEKIFSEYFEGASEQSRTEQNSLISDETPITQDLSGSESSRASSSSRSSVSVSSGQKEELEQAIAMVENDEMNSASSTTSVRSLSARESWSEGSTESHSDEKEDEEQWNDWLSDESLIDLKSVASGEEEMVIEEYDEDVHNFNGGSDDSDEYTADSSSEDSDDPSVGFVGGLLRQIINRRSRKRAYFRGRNSSRGNSESSNSISDIAAEFDTDDQQALHKTPANQRGKLLIYDTTSNESIPIFRYERVFPRLIYNSPPIFHPTAPLVVWPLGGGEILFANFDQKTYYTRTLRCSATRSCHVSIQGRFSPCGEYLHLGTLEVREDAPPHLGPVKPCIHLSFQLSTHRLSKRKTARSPPRLIYRVGVPLDSLETLSVSPLPYTLTWTASHVYISKSQEILQVIRVPLFRTPKGASSTDVEMPPDNKEGAECHVKSNEIFLPSSANARQVRYFAPNQTAKAKGLATVILGSMYPSLPGGTLNSRYETIHPMGVYVDEQSQLGGWKLFQGNEPADARKNVSLGGRLQGKFERFDRTDDCDIVPYLF
jgi:hypothetical protein